MEKHWFIGLCQLASRADPRRILSWEDRQPGGSSAGWAEDPQLGGASAGRIISQRASPIPPPDLDLFVY